MEYDSFIKKLKEKFVGFSGGGLRTFVSESENEYSNIDHALNGTDDMTIVWKDAVGSSLGEVIEGVKTSFESLKLFPKNVIEPVAGQIEPLDESLKLYTDLVDKYNECENEYKLIYVGYEPQKANYEEEYAFKMAHDSWSSKKRNKEQKMDELKLIFDDVEKEKENCYSLFNKINGILGSSTSVEAPKGDFNSLFVATVEQELDDGSLRIAIQHYDELGNLEKEEYKIVDSDGNVIEDGKVFYHSKGKTVEYNKYPQNESDRSALEERGITDEYDEHDKLLTRKIDVRVIDGRREEKGVTITYDKDGSEKTLDVEEIITDYGEKFYNKHHDYKENVITYDKIEREDGTIEKKVVARYNERQVEQSFEIEEIDKPDGSKMYKVFKNANNDTVSIDRIEYSDGTTEYSVVEQHDNITEKITSRTIEYQEKSDKMLYGSVKETYDEDGNLVRREYKHVKNISDRTVEDAIKEIEDESKTINSNQPKIFKTEKEIENDKNNMMSDLDKKYESLGGPYTEEGKKDMMLAYIEEEYKDSIPAGLTSEDIYKAWKNGGTIPTKTTATIKAASVVSTPDPEPQPAPTPTPSKPTPTATNNPLNEDEIRGLVPGETKTVYDKSGKAYKMTLTGDSKQIVIEDSNGKLETEAPLNVLMDGKYYSENPNPTPTPTPAPTTKQGVTPVVTDNQKAPSSPNSTPSKPTPTSTNNPLNEDEIRGLVPGETKTVYDKSGKAYKMTLTDDPGQIVIEDSNGKLVTEAPLNVLMDGKYYSENPNPTPAPAPTPTPKQEVTPVSPEPTPTPAPTPTPTSKKEVTPVATDNQKTSTPTTTSTSNPLNEDEIRGLVPGETKTVYDKSGNAYKMTLTDDPGQILIEDSNGRLETEAPLNVLIDGKYYSENPNPTPAPTQTPTTKQGVTPVVTDNQKAPSSPTPAPTPTPTSKKEVTPVSPEPTPSKPTPTSTSNPLNEDEIRGLVPGETKTVYDKSGNAYKMTLTDDPGQILIEDSNGKLETEAPLNVLIDGKYYSENPNPTPAPTPTPMTKQEVTPVSPGPTPTPAPTLETEEKTIGERFNTRQREKRVVSGPPVEIKATPINDNQVEQKPVEQKPVEQKPVEQKPVEQKTVDTNPKNDNGSSSSNIPFINKMNSQYDVVKSMPYTEDGRKDAMIQYIKQQYNCPEILAERLYDKWINDPNSTGR